MKLEDFRAEKGLSYAGLADLIGCGITPKMAERYCKGTKPRSARVVLRIVEATGGRVTPNDWYYAAAEGGADAPAAEPAESTA